MASYLATYAANKLLGLMLGATSWTPPATVYVRLYTVMPDAAGAGGTEVSGGSYAALSVTNNTTNFPVPSDGVVTNGTAFTWSAPTANWGTLVGAALWDAASGGNMLAAGPFSVNYPVNNGDPAFSIAAGAASFSFIASE